MPAPAPPRLVQIRLPRDICDTVDALGKKERRTRANMVLALVARALAATPPPVKKGSPR